MIKKFEEFTNKTVLFADLDRTIITPKSGDGKPIDENDWKFKEGFLDALVNFNPEILHIVTNQGGIGKHKVDESKWNLKVSKIIDEIKQHTGDKCMISYDYCPTNNDDDIRRKPNPGMLIDFFAAMHTAHADQIDKDDCLMIGDASGKPGDFSDSDKMCAVNFGIDYMDIEEFIRKYSR